MREKFRRNEKQIRDGNIQLRITTYFLSKFDTGLRIEVRRLGTKLGNTVEIELLRGDDLLILKRSYQIVVLTNPKRNEIGQQIESMVQYAFDKILLRD